MNKYYTMPSYHIIIGFLIALVLSSCGASEPDELQSVLETLPEEIDFNFHVRPILSDRCYSCHGPDDAARKGDLRLDIETDAKGSLINRGSKAIVEGAPHNSAIIERILSTDKDLKMPPPESNLVLSTKEKAILYKWIDQGAKWKKHWAFTPPQKESLPDPNDDWTSTNEIDLFVHAALKVQGLQPSPEAGKERLLRRVTMDLTGLPPTPKEIKDFLNDDAPNAYENVVDRLLSSRANAERLTMEWLDLSRYADSHGLHADGYRMMWPWRDWVIDAFESNMPYDKFVSDQLAGDLLPDPTPQQILATAFNRNHTMTGEGGAIDEEFRLNYVFDRTETFATAFQGLTMNCARCHDHKFDPISQKDYYQLSSFFNNVKEVGMTGDDGNYGPMLALPDPSTLREIAAIEEKINANEKNLIRSKEALEAKTAFITTSPSRTLKKDLVVHAPFDKVVSVHKENIVDDNKNVVSAALNDIVPGKWDKALTFTGVYDEVYLKEVPTFDRFDPFSASLWINTTKRNSEKMQMLLCTSGDKNNFWRG